jgi:hypothetical protein
VPITSVGVDKFVLVQRGAGSDAALLPSSSAPSPRAEAGGGAGSASGEAEGDVILLRVTIPQASIALRACEVGSGTAPSLLLTCYPPKDSGASSSFTVQLTGGGTARPLAGLAAPSQQAQAGLAAAAAGGGGDGAGVGSGSGSGGGDSAAAAGAGAGGVVARVGNSADAGLAAAPPL